jgi:hypothetical protein
MGEALYDKEGNQIYSGKGRKSSAVKELLDSGDVYLMKDDNLIKIGGKSSDEIQAEIDNWLEKKQKQLRNNCSVCKYYKITHELWTWSKKHGLCTRNEAKVEETLATGGCKYLCRPGDSNIHEEWKEMSSDERKEVVQEHKEKRIALQNTFDTLLEKKLISKADHKEKIIFAKTACKDNIHLLDKYNEAYTKRLRRAEIDPKVQALIKKKQKAIKETNRKEVAEFFGVKYVKGEFKVSKDKRYRSASGLANHLGAEVEFRLREGWVFKYNDNTIGPIKA